MSEDHKHDGMCQSMYTTPDGETWYCTEDFDHDGDHLARDGGRVTIFERW